MRKIYAALLSLLFLLLWKTETNAQVSAYGFTQDAGTYTLIAGATVHGSGWDDAVINVVLPFSFVFNGVSYTAVNVSSNGFISFGATSPGTTNYSPISSATAYAGAVSAFGRDLISNATTVTQTTLGSGPNRQFVV